MVVAHFTNFIEADFSSGRGFVSRHVTFRDEVFPLRTALPSASLDTFAPAPFDTFIYVASNASIDPLYVVLVVISSGYVVDAFTFGYDTCADQRLSLLLQQLPLSHHL